MATVQEILEEDSTEYIEERGILTYNDTQLDIIRQAVENPEMSINELAEKREDEGKSGSSVTYIRNVLQRATQQDVEEHLDDVELERPEDAEEEVEEIEPEEDPEEAPDDEEAPQEPEDVSEGAVSGERVQELVNENDLSLEQAAMIAKAEETTGYDPSDEPGAIEMVVGARGALDEADDVEVEEVEEEAEEQAEEQVSRDEVKQRAANAAGIDYADVRGDEEGDGWVDVAGMTLSDIPARVQIRRKDVLKALAEEGEESVREERFIHEE